MAINLTKGQRINLEKSNGTKLQNVCVGINWGAIEKKGLFGLSKTKGLSDSNFLLSPNIKTEASKSKPVPVVALLVSQPKPIVNFGAFRLSLCPFCRLIAILCLFMCA